MATPGSKTTANQIDVLATDLDGTLIPLSGNQQNEIALEQLRVVLREKRIELVFVTGRHLDSVAEAIAKFHLPNPDWVICDVGTSIYQSAANGSFAKVEEYQQALQAVLGGHNIASLARKLAQLSGLRLQEPEKQGQFKLSYYVNQSDLQRYRDAIREVLHSHNVPHEIISSVDPFNDDGLIDILPPGVSKAFALQWWATARAHEPGSIVFAGDSGNDLAAMTAGYKTIVVENAGRQLARQIAEYHQSSGWPDRLWLARSQATSGVFEGLKYFMGSPKTSL